MNIGVVVDNDLNNDKRVLREIEILREDGNKIHVLCFGFGKKVYNSPDGIEITRIRISRRLKNILFFFFNFLPVYEWLWAFKIKKFIKENNIDVIHAHDMYMSKCSYRGIRQSGKKVKMVLDLHENFAFAVTTYNWTKGFFRSRISRPEKWAAKEKEYLEYADRIIVLSEAFRDLLVNRYPTLRKDNFTALPNVPDLKQLTTENKLTVKALFKTNYPVLFYYGVIAERRGVFDALEVFIELLKENYQVNFLLIGPVDKKDKNRFESLINSDHLRDRIHYISWIDSIYLPSYLEIVDICLAPFHKNPQHESGVANKIYEYMYGRKPVIASDCLPQQNLIEKHNCGLVFRNMREFHDTIIKLMNDSALRSLMGENGHKAVVEEYNSDRIKENLIDLYKTISTKF